MKLNHGLTISQITRPTATAPKITPLNNRCAAWRRNSFASCWRMSWRERLNALVYGKVWVAVLSGKTQPPIYIEASKNYFKETP